MQNVTVLQLGDSEAVSEAVSEARRICEAHGLEWPGNETLAAVLVGELLKREVVVSEVDSLGVRLPNGMRP